MTRILHMKTSCHRQMCIEEEDLTKEEHAVLSRIMRNKWMDSDDYKAKKNGNPFFQGGYDREEGWALIEFWHTDKEVCQRFIDYVNGELSKIAH